jgi:inorganic pyrophosphatase
VVECINSLEAVVETPKFGFVKRSTDGSIDFVSPLPCPFNYGRIDGTTSGDGDPLDAIILGPRLAIGSRCNKAQRGTVWFIDGGKEDPKVVLSDRPLDLLDKIEIRAFFSGYVLFKRMLNLARGKSGRTWVRAFEGI